MKVKKEGSDNNPQLAEISSKLDILIRLSSLGLVKDMKTQKEQIASLSDAGFKPKEIAGILRTSQNTVNVTLNAIRKERASAEREEEETRPTPKEITPTKSETEVKQDAENQA